MHSLFRCRLGLVAIGFLALFVTVGIARAETALTPPAVSSAFPAHTAGMAAYAKLDQGLNLEKVKSVFTEFVSQGDNYIVGIVEIDNFGAKSQVYLYLDSDGWLVSFLRRGTPAAAMMQWNPADAVTPKIGAITRNVLQDAIFKATQTDGISYLPDVGYYDFSHPTATNMTLFVKTVSDPGTGLTQVEIPDSWRLFEASFFHYSFDVHQSQIKLDDAVVSTLDAANDGGYWNRRDDFLPGVKLGKLHKIELTFDNFNQYYTGSAGVAVALIYTKGSVR